MPAFDDGNAPLPPEGARHQYLALAEAALAHYALGLATPTFIQHNAAIVFRVDATATGRAYLLKLFARVGTGTNPSTAQLEAGLRWLADLALHSDVVVQVPVATITGQLVCQIMTGDDSPINCTVQHWVDGQPPRGHFTPHQVRQIGALMAKLHTYCQLHPLSGGVPAMRHDAAALRTNVGILRSALDTTVLPPDAYALILAAQERIASLMAHLGTNSEVWGPVHGDLHHDNLLFHGDEVRPIDFSVLRLAHYTYDLGVTLYHIFYQGPEVRRALLEAYRQIRPLPDICQRHIEAFVTYAAIDNIAWNSTVPEQARSALFRRNLQQLVSEFCAPLAEERAFLFS